jgi:hypothetical protein
MWLVQAVSWLPEALRPGVFVVIIIVLLWFVLIRRGLPEAWRATCRVAARAIDLSVGAVLRIEYVITSARRRRGESPPRWAFALAGVSETLEDCAARLYHGSRPRANEDAADHPANGEKVEAKTPARARKPPIPWRLCTAILVITAGAWIAMNQLSPTSIPRYRISQAFDPWRDVEEWAGAPSDRETQPILVRTRRHRALINTRLVCRSANGCRGWLLLKGNDEALVAVHYVNMREGQGSIVVPFHRTPKQKRAVPIPELVVAGV